MRQWYGFYAARPEFVQQLVSQTPWGHKPGNHEDRECFACLEREEIELLFLPRSVAQIFRGNTGIERSRAWMLKPQSD